MKAYLIAALATLAVTQRELDKIPFSVLSPALAKEFDNMGPSEQCKIEASFWTVVIGCPLQNYIFSTQDINGLLDPS